MHSSSLFAYLSVAIALTLQISALPLSYESRSLTTGHDAARLEIRMNPADPLVNKVVKKVSGHPNANDDSGSDKSGYDSPPESSSSSESGSSGSSDNGPNDVLDQAGAESDEFDNSDSNATQDDDPPAAGSSSQPDAAPSAGSSGPRGGDNRPDDTANPGPTRQSDTPPAAGSSSQTTTSTSRTSEAPADEPSSTLSRSGSMKAQSGSGQTDSAAA